MSFKGTKNLRGFKKINKINTFLLYYYNSSNFLAILSKDSEFLICRISIYNYGAFIRK